jgi:hypothetical protein
MRKVMRVDMETAKQIDGVHHLDHYSRYSTVLCLGLY